MTFSVVCKAFTELGPTHKIPAELMLRTLEVNFKSPVLSPSVAVAKAILLEGGVVKAELLSNAGHLHAAGEATFGSISSQVSKHTDMRLELETLKSQALSSPHLAVLADVSASNTPEQQHLLHDDKQLESLREVHIGRRGEAADDETLTRWPDTILSQADLGELCSVGQGYSSIHPAPLWALMDHVLAHAHVNSYGTSSVTASQRMEFFIDPAATVVPAQVVGKGRSVSRKGRSGQTEGEIVVAGNSGSKVVVKGRAVMVDRVPQPSAEERFKLYGPVGELRHRL